MHLVRDPIPMYADLAHALPRIKVLLGMGDRL
jgi:hypothetical protein